MNLSSILLMSNMESLLLRYIGFVMFVVTAVVHFLLILPTGTKAQGPVVSFTTPSDIVVVGRSVQFTCSTLNFNTVQDEVQILVNNVSRILYANGNFAIYGNHPVGYFKTEIQRNDQDTPIGIEVTINVINEIDAGEYRCIMTLSTVPYNSQLIEISVKHIPEPTCFVTETPSVFYDTKLGVLTTSEGIEVSILCYIDPDTNSVPVSLEWSRSDGKMVSQSHTFGVEQVLTFSTTSSDNGVITFTCTSKNSSYEGITHNCTINIFITETSSQSLENIPSTFLTQSYFGSTIKATTNSPTTDNSAELPIGLIVGAGGAVGVLCLAVIVIGCICIIRSTKRKKQGATTNDNDHSILGFRGDHEHVEITALPITSSNENPIMDTSAAPNQTSSAIYENSEHARVVYPSLHHNDPHSDQANIDSNIGNFQVEANYPNLDNGNELTYPIPPRRTSSSTSQASPVYADVNKKSKSVSSVVSNSDTSLPSYAAVDKNRHRNKSQSAGLGSSTLPRNSAQEVGALHYANVNNVNTSSSSGQSSARSPETFYSSVPP